MSVIFLPLIVLFFISAVITGPAGVLSAIANRHWQALLMLTSPALTVIYLVIEGVMNNHDGKHFYISHHDAHFAVLIYGAVQIALITSVLWMCRREGRNAAILMGHASLVTTLVMGFSMGMALANDWL